MADCRRKWIHCASTTSNEKNYTTKLHDIANYLFKDNAEYKLHSFVFPLLCVCATFDLSFEIWWYLE